MSFISLKPHLLIVLFFLIALFGIGVESSTSGVTESEIETITKCLEDLNSPLVDIRKRAVMVLGKYSHRMAQQGIVKSLTDDDAGIRRSALVSITEKRPLPPNSRNIVLQLIGDSDVHIRRIASSYIPDIMGMGRGVIIISNKYNAGGFPPELKAVIRRAFQDDDSTVRKNMITNYRHFKRFVPHKLITDLLRDTDRDVRVLALNACNTSLPKNQFIDETRFLAEDADRTIRLQYVKILSRYSINMTKGILDQLATDDDFLISTEALLILFNNNDFSYYTELRNRLDNNQMDSISASKIIRRLPSMKANGESALVELINHRNSTYRQVSLQTYGNYFWKSADLELMVPLLNDPLQQIRESAGRILLRNKKLDVTHYDILVQSRYSDTREFAIQYSRKMNAGDAQKLLIDLIIDDVNAIRISAIKEMINRKLNGWEDILRQTLIDHSDEIRNDVIRLISKSRDKVILSTALKIAVQTGDTALQNMFNQNAPIRRNRNNTIRK